MADTDEHTKHLKNFEALTAGDASLPTVLIFGGSTFMGRALVEQLLAKPARICLCNRGREYWGINDPSGGRAARIVGDRRKVSEFSARIDAATNLLGKKWDLVADFSAYNGADIRASLDGLRGRFGVYAYISSDSAYEVSSLAASKWMPPPCPAGAEKRTPQVDESFDKRPDDKKERQRLRKADSYGDGKLEAEEALRDGLPEGCRSVSCRLPDVIGPFDDTLRLWAYWHWLQAGSEGAPPPQVSEGAQGNGGYGSKRPRDEASEEPPKDPDLAVVYSQDVARFIVGLLAWIDVAPPGAPQHDAVNLGCERQEPLGGMLGVFAAASGLGDAPKLSPVKRPKSFLPSVDRPWPLTFNRAKQIYGFTATPLEEVFKACHDWFHRACGEFPREARKAAMKLPRESAAVAVKRARLEDAPRSSSSSSGGSSSSG